VAKKPKAPKEVTVKGPSEEAFLRHPAPLSRAELIGHERPLRIFDDAMAAGRVHHAWIFHGPKGVGKRTAAITFASMLLDPTTQKGFSGEFEPDPASRTQELMKAGTHPDLFIIVKELAKYHEDPNVRDRKLTSISAEVIRSFLVEPATMKATVATTAAASRVFIVDDADLLNLHAQNALLKILEEPPPGVVFVLVTSAEQELLPTIRSRSQRVYFAPLTEPQMHAWHEQFSRREAKEAEIGSEPRELDADELGFLKDFAAGSPGVFVAARDGGMHAWWKQIGSMLVAAEKGQYSPEFGASMADLVTKWAEAFVDEHDNASKEAANKEAAAWMFRLVGHHVRRRMREAARGADGAAKVQAHLAMLEKLLEAETEIDANVNAAFVMEKLSGELSLIGAR
jgi:hypothetical protein